MTFSTVSFDHGSRYRYNQWEKIKKIIIIHNKTNNLAFHNLVIKKMGLDFYKVVYVLYVQISS